MTTTLQLMTREQRDVIVNLHITDQQTKGHPVVRPEEVPTARQWLLEVLADSDKLSEHAALLAELYRGVIRPPTSRRDRWHGEPAAWPSPSTFTHFEPLAEGLAKAIAENGSAVATLTEDQLARLLLNPFALYDLADLIRTTLPNWWIEPMAAAGRAMIRRHNLVIDLPENLEKVGRKKQRLVRTRGGRVRDRTVQPWQDDSREVTFDESELPLKRRIAACLYGEPDREFQLTLHRHRAAEAGAYVVELEVAPGPVKDDLTLAVSINGYVREFKLAVPASVRLDPEADPPANAFARAEKLVPEDAFHLKGETMWCDDAGTLRLILS
jgi:hypothetical protein